MRLRGEKSISPRDSKPKAATQNAVENHLLTLKARPKRAIASASAVMAPVDNASDSGSSLTASDDDQPVRYLGDASTVSQVVGGDDIDSDQPAKRGRLSLSRPKLNVPAPQQQEDSDDTPAPDEHDDTDSVELDALAHEVPTPEEAEAADVATDHEDITSFLQVPVAESTRQTSPSKRGGRRQRGGRGKFGGGGLNRGNLLTPKKNTARDDSMARQSPGGAEVTGILDRLPGRRRAHHADIDIEVDLRRQLELRVGYRALAKALKPLLAEIANRTVSDLKAEEESYKQCPEYQEVLDELDERLQQRLNVIQTEHDEEEQRLQRIHAAEDVVIHDSYETTVLDLQSNALLHCQFELLEALRRLDNGDRHQPDRINNGPPEKTYQFHNSAPYNLPLQHCYVGETHHMSDTTLQWDRFETRVKLGLALHAYDPEAFKYLTANDAITNEERETAFEAMALLQMLVDAAAAVERNPLAPRLKVLPNSAAIGLNALADAVSMTTPLKTTQTVPANAVAQSQDRTQYAPSQGPPAGVYPQPAKAKTPPAASLRSPPITPRSRPFVPTISSIINADPPPEPVRPAVSAPQPPAQHLPPVHADIMTGQTARRPQAPEVVNPHRTTSTHNMTVEPLNNSARDALAYKASNVPTTQANPFVAPRPSELLAVPEPPKKIRKRPGPRAIYTKQTAPDIVPAGQEFWSPFTNSMGPPTYLPKYVKDADLVRRGSGSGKDAQDPGVRRPSTSADTAMTQPVDNPGQARRASGARHPSVPNSSVPGNAVNPPQPQEMRPQHDRQHSRFGRPDAPIDPQAMPPPGSHHWPHQNIYYNSQTFYGPYPMVPPGQTPPAAPAQPAQAQPAAHTPHASQGPSAAQPSRASQVPPAQQPPPANHLSRASQAPSTTPAPQDNGVRQRGHPRPRSTTTYPHPQEANPYAIAPYPNQRARHAPQGEAVVASRERDTATRSRPSTSGTRPRAPLPLHRQPSLPPVDMMAAFIRYHGVHLTEDQVNKAKEIEAQINEAKALHRSESTASSMRRSSHVQPSAPTARPSSSYSSNASAMPPRAASTAVPSTPMQPVAPQPRPEVPNAQSTARPSMDRHPSTLPPVLPTPAPIIADANKPMEPRPEPTAPTRKPPPPATPMQTPTTREIPIQPAPHPNFRGQRPKHHEWRNWTSAVPPPSSGANYAAGAAVPTMIPSTNGAGVYSSSGTRRKRTAAKAKGAAQGGGESGASGSQGQGQGGGQQAGMQKQWRFESQNKKFEGAGAAGGAGAGTAGGSASGGGTGVGTGSAPGPGVGAGIGVVTGAATGAGPTLISGSGSGPGAGAAGNA